MHRRFTSVLRLSLLVIMIGGLLFPPQGSAYAAGNLSVTPITWNVIGLDSNNVNIGPNNFPVGVRVCNTGNLTATGISADFVWDTTDALIDLRSGSQDPIALASLAAGACHDFYFEVTVVRSSSAYDHVRRYHIQVTATNDGAGGMISVSSPTPREIYVEHLVSQNRNSVTNILVDGIPIAAGGTMNLNIGQTYTIELVGATATQGYEQLESFINFPNTVFQINSVASTYTANAGTDANAATKLYADGCGWVNDPTDVTTPAYRECAGTGKYGGDITITYNVTIIATSASSGTINTLIYDFSGSSYHYNSDFSTSSRIFNIIDPNACTQSTIAAWNFNSSLTAASTDNAVGTPSITANSLSAASSVAGASGGAGDNARSHTSWNTGALNLASDFLQFDVSTEGYYNINFSYDLFRSAQGPTNVTAAHDDDGVGTPTALTTDALAATTWTSFAKDVSAITAMDNASNARFRIYGHNAGNTSGTMRVDNFTVTGCKLPSSLSLAKSGSPGYFIGAGETITYTYTLTNTGQVSLQAPYTITDSKGAAMTISCAGAASPLAVGASTTCTGTYTTTAADVSAGLVTNIATASTTTVISDPVTSNQASETVELAAMSIAKQVSTSAAGPWSDSITVNVGETVFFQITVDNTGNADLNNVTVDDGMTACTLAGPTGDADIDNILDAAETWVYTCSITAVAGSNITNTATADSTETSNNPVTDTASYTGQQSDLTVTKANNVSGSVPLGGSFTWTLTVSNGGTGSAVFADLRPILTDLLPSGATYGAPVVGNITNITNSGNISCNITVVTFLACSANGAAVTIGAGGSFTVVFVVTPASTGTLSNTATVDSDNEVPEIDETNNTGSDSVNVTPVADLAITKTNGVTSLDAGSTTTYTIRVTNNGPSNVSLATLSDPAVTGLNKTNVACSAGQCVIPPTVTELESGTFILPDLASGAFYEITVTADVTLTSFNSSVTNTATVTPAAGTNDPTPGNNTASDTDPVKSVVDMTVTKTDGVTSVNAGGTTTYTVRATNNGPSDASLVIFNDPAVAGLTKTSVACSATPGLCVTPPTIAELEGNTFILPDMTSGQFYEITVTVNVTATSGSVTNTANVFVLDPAFIDPNTNNNTASDTDTVNPIIDLSLDKQVSNTTPNVGSTITFTLVVANAGPSTATNTVITDVVPSGYTYVAASITGGDTRNDTSPAGTGLTWTINSLASGASVNLTYQVTVLATGTYDNYAEITSHTQTDADSTPGNASTTEDDDDLQTVTPTPVIDVSLDKQVSNATPNVGSTITFTLVIANAGPSTATNTIITDVVPSGYSYVAASIAGGDTRNDTNPPTTGLTWTVNSLASGASVNLTYQVVVLPSGTYDNYAEITSHTQTDSDSTPGNGSTTEDDDDIQTVTPTSVIDISLDKQVSNATPNVGSTITFTLAIANAGPSTATNVVVTDVVPSGYAYVTASIAGGDARTDTNPSTTGLTWTINSLAAGASVNLTYQVTVLATGTYDNYAEITSHTQTDTDSTPGNGSTTEDDDDTQTVTPVSIVDLSLDKQVSNATPNVGSTVTFTLVIANAGPSTATNISITDVIPSGYAYVSASIAGGDANNDTNPATTGLTWTINSLASGASVNLTYQVTVAASGTYDNYAEITNQTQTDSDSTPGNGSTTEDDDDTETVNPVAVVDVSLDKQISNATPNVGSTLTFTLVIANAGPSTATNVVVTDVIPNGYSYVAGSITGGNTNDDTNPATSGLTWTINSLASGASVNLTYQVTVLASGAYDNYAEITSHTQTDSDSTPGNNSTTEDDDDIQTVTPTPIIDVSLDKQVSNAAPNVGSTVTFTLVVSNAGPSTANGIFVIDALPSGYSYVPASIAGGDTRNDTNPSTIGLVWTINSLAPGASVNLTYQAVVLPTGAYDNYAQILDHNEIDSDSTPGDDSTTEDDDDIVAVTPIPVIDLSLDKQVSNATPNVGSTVTFTLLVANAGPSAATNIVLTDILPSGYSYVAASIAGGDARDDTNPATAGLTWTINTLASGASVNLTYQATVLATGTYDNYAEISSHTQTDVDSTPGNGSTTEDDDDTETVTPVAVIDVSLDKQVSSATPNVGSTVTFTLAIANAGPSTATNVVVTDVVPSGYSYVAASITGGDTNSDANPGTSGLTWTINSLASGATVNLTYQASVLASGTYDNYAEITSHTQTDSDSTPGNGSATEDDDDTQAVTPAAVIDVSLDKQVSNATPNVGSTVTFTLAISNAGPSTATSVVVTDVVPNGYGYVAASITGGNTRDDTNPATTGLTWTINSLASGASVNLTYQVTVLATGVYDNYAEIASHTQTDSDSTPGNGSTTEDDDDTQTVTPAAVVDVSLDKQVSNATPNTGDTVTFTLVIANAGPSAATNIVVTDVVPSGYTYVAASITGGTTNNDTNPATSGLTWTINSLASGASINLTYQATVLTTGIFANYAEITSHTETDVDSTPGNNSTNEDDNDTVIVTPASTIDVSLDKQVSSATPNVGSSITFTLVIANAGPSAATNIVVTDVVPSGYTYVAASITGGNTNNDANPSTTGLTWMINSLAAGASVNLTYQTTVLATGTYDNYAEIMSHTETDVDSTPGNGSTTEDDDDTQTVTPTPIIDVSLDKQVSNATPNVGSTVTFILVIANAGPSTATNIVVTDVVPNGYTYVAASIAGGDASNDTSPAGTGLTWTINSLASGASVNLTYDVTVLASGIYDNYAEITSHTQTDSDSTPGNGSTTEDDDDRQTISRALIGVSKRVVSQTEISSGTWDVTYEIRVENFGNVALNNVQVLDDLTTTFPSPTTFTVQSVTSAAFTENPGYNGDTDVDLLTGGDSLAVGASGTITLVVRVVPASAGPFNNLAIAGGQCPACNTPVIDISQNGTDPDPDNDSDPTNNNVPTTVNFGPNLFDPPFGLKILDASGLPVLQWTMVWINNSNIVAVNAQVSDPIVAGTTFVAGSLTCTPSGVTTTSSCTYDAGTNRILWSGSLGPDLGATDAASAVNEITITFRVNVVAGITSVLNVATVDSDLNGNSLITDPGEQQVASASARWTAQATTAASINLPTTGFAPNVVTDLGNVPQATYMETNGVIIEIPSLGVKIPIVGVPKKDGTWNVSWLGNQAGWLAGTAFPSWSGNSVLTGHVYNSNGLPGPFVNLNKLKYGDQIIIHAYGQNYIFEVRSDEVVEPNDKSVLKHEEKPWLTLVTCKDYDEKTNTYKKRVVVRAVLVKVTTE